MQTSFTPEQLANPDLAAADGILRKCVHCGFCTATCPTYVLLGDELDSPRGRIYLIKEMLEHSAPATAAVVAHLDRCLSCLGCMTTCPSGVHYQHLIDQARVHVERTYARPLGERLLRALLAYTLPYPARLRASLALAAALHRLATAMPRLARAIERRLPQQLQALLALSPARVPPRVHLAATDGPAQGTRRGRIALLAGCAQSVLAGATHAASARLLRRSGFDVVTIEGCCGALVHHLGRDEHACTLAAQVIDRILAERARHGVDVVVATASGCGAQLKDYGHLFRAHALARAAQLVSALTRDLTEVVHTAGLPRPVAGRGLAVAYHSACSLQHGQRISEAPRSLLAQAGFSVREIGEGHLCCGSAGTYNILQPQLASRLRDRKLEHVALSGAAVVAAGNLGCITQLASRACVPVVHTAELLDWATGGPRPEQLPAQSLATPAGSG